MISYGPFGNPVSAKIGLTHLITRKLGVTRSMNMGIVWQDGDQCQFLQPCRPYPNGYSEMMLITADHVKKPLPRHDHASPVGIAWNAINTVSDAVFTVMSYMAATAAFAAAFDAGAGVGAAAGAVVMLAFTGAETLDAAALLFADGITTLLQVTDEITDGHSAQRFKDTIFYKFIETWGPIIALPAVAHDLYAEFSLNRDARLLSDLRTQMTSRAKQILREMRATDAFIGAEGDLALRDSYAFLKESVHQIREELTEIKRDFRTLTNVGLPADVIGVLNDVVNWQDIAGGAMADLNQMNIWLRQGATAAGGWLGSAGSWLSAGTARANAYMPRQMGSTYQAARFGGIHFTPGEAKMRIVSLFPITMHLIGGTHAKPLKARR